MRIHFLAFIVVFVSCSVICNAQSFSITNDPRNQTVTIGNSSLKMVLNYNHQCSLSSLDVNKVNVISGTSGLYSEIKSKDNTFSTRQLQHSPKKTSS